MWEAKRNSREEEQEKEEETEVPSGPCLSESDWSPIASLRYPNGVICYSDTSRDLLAFGAYLDICCSCLPE